jgi:hypothetical protein
MRVLASLLIAVQLLLSVHALWHHHEDDHSACQSHDHSTDHSTDHGSPCEYCRVLHQPSLLPAPLPVVFSGNPVQRAVCEAYESLEDGAHEQPNLIRGPPGLLAV